MGQQDLGYKRVFAHREMVAALFRLENSRSPEDIILVLETLIEWLQAPEQADLARALVVWIRRSLLASRMPDVDIPEIGRNSGRKRAGRRASPPFCSNN